MKAMNYEGAEMLDSDLLSDAESTFQRPALPASEDLMTRLPPMNPPPAQFVAPNPQVMPGSYPPPPYGPAQGYAHPQAVQDVRYRSDMPPAPQRPSWLQSLLSSTFPPRTATAPDPQVAAQASLRNRRVLAFFCITLALALAVVAVMTALHGTADDLGLAPVVMASLALSRAILTVGIGAFSFGFLRMAERLLTKGA